jgi:cytochrome c-type biogenesis protein CcmH/NrfG
MYLSVSERFAACRSRRLRYRKVLEQLLMLDATNPGNLMRKEQMADMYLRLGRLLKGKAEGRKMTLQSLEMMKSIADRQGATPDQLGEYADELLRAEPVDLRNPGEALRYAQLASSSAGERNPTYLGLVAEAEYQLGRRAEAVSTAEKALGLLPADSAGREQLQRHIVEYRVGGGK